MLAVRHFNVSHPLVLVLKTKRGCSGICLGLGQEVTKPKEFQILNIELCALLDWNSVLPCADYDHALQFPS